VARDRFSNSLLRHNLLSRNPNYESGLLLSKWSGLKVFAKLFDLGPDLAAWMDQLSEMAKAASGINAGVALV